MEIAALAAFLAPCLPYLLKSGERVAEEASRALGGEVWEHAKRLWSRLRGPVEERPSAAEVVADTAENPHDDRRQVALELALEKILAEDEGLAREVERLWQDARSAVIASGDGSLAIGGGVQGSTVVSGDGNTVRYGR